LVYFPSFWYIVSRKIWQPWLKAASEVQVGADKKHLHTI
jgi:hypothetical protein